VATLATESWTGTNGAAWPAQWTTGGVNSANGTIQGNAGQLTFGTGTSYASGARAQLSGLTATRDLDVTVQVTFSQVTTEEYFWIALRSSPDGVTGTPTNAYFLNLYPANGATSGEVEKRVSGTSTTLSNGLVLGTWTAGVARNVRFQAVGNTVQVKVWNVGAAEPATWNYSTTDTSLSGTTGTVWFGTFVGAGSTPGTVSVDNLTVTDGNGISWVNRTAVQAPRNGTTSHTVNFAPATAGNLLVALTAGGVTSSTPTGWALPTGGSAVNSQGFYLWTKTAAAGESSFTTTHNGSNYPVAVMVYEFGAGSTVLAVNSDAGSGNGSAGTAGLSGVATGSKSFFAAADTGMVVAHGSSPCTWSGVTGLVKDLDLYADPSGTDGYAFSVAHLDSTATSFAPVSTFTSVDNGDVERINFAVNVVTAAPTPQATFAGSGTLAVTGTARPATTAAVSGAGTLGVTGTPTPTGTVALTGSGALTGQPGASLTLAGSGALTRTSATPTVTVAVTFLGAGTFIANSPRQAAFGSTGTLNVTGTFSQGASVTFGGTGQLASSGVAAQWRFYGPITYDYQPIERTYPPNRLVGYLAYGQTVWQDSAGQWHQQYAPNPDALVGALRVYTGGRVWPLTDADRLALIAGGFGDYLALETIT
jgi:hypothetical protein